MELNENNLNNLENDIEKDIREEGTV